MKAFNIAVALFVFILFNPATAQEKSPVAAESRDASLAYMGTSNFIVATIANRCKGFIKDGKSSKEFILEWQERNAKYIVAAALYMEHRLADALKNGGAEERNAVFEEVTTVSRENGKAAIQSFFANKSKEETCDKVLGLIGNGTFDITPQLDIYHELEELAAWAQQQ